MAHRCDTQQATSARLSVALAFFLTGLVFATWASRIPAIKQDLGLGDGDLAVALVGLNAGAIVGLQVGGMVVPRTGSRAALRVALPLFAVSLVIVALAQSLIALTMALIVTALVNSVVDVAMNAHGVTVERQLARPLLSSLHAMHPLGGMVGAGIGAGAARLDAGILSHFATVAVVVAAVAVIGTRPLLSTTADATPPARRHGDPGTLWSEWLGGWSGRILFFGSLAFCATLAEGAALDWSAVYLHDALGAGSDLAAAGVSVFLGGLTLGRLAGDRLILRLGPVATYRAGSLVAGLGFGAALLLDTVWAGIAGLALLGLGIACLLPLLIGVAGTLEPDPSGAATIVARVSTLGYLGSFVGPALIGLLVRPLGLPVALLVPACVIASTALVAGRIATTRQRR